MFSSCSRAAATKSIIGLPPISICASYRAPALFFRAPVFSAPPRITASIQVPPSLFSFFPDYLHNTVFGILHMFLGQFPRQIRVPGGNRLDNRLMLFQGDFHPPRVGKGSLPETVNLFPQVIDGIGQTLVPAGLI